MNTQATNEKPTPAEKLKAAEDMCADLNRALRTAGVKLPSLSVEPCAYADANPSPLIQLGHCNQETALALLTALTR